MRGWARTARQALAQIPDPRLGRLPEAPALPVRDPWPGDAAAGAHLLRGEPGFPGVVRSLALGSWAPGACNAQEPAPLAALAHGFTWLRDLRALGTDAARSRARALVADWIGAARLPAIASRPDIAGARLAAWLGHYDFFAASADDPFRQRLLARVAADARRLAASLPADEIDGRTLTALKGLIAAAVSLPEHAPSLTRALKLLPSEIARQVLPDGCHAERSPVAQLAALQDLTEIRALLQAAQAVSPPSLGAAIERMAPALRALRHGDGGLVLFNGAKEGGATLIELVLTQAGRGGRAPSGLTEGGFHRLQAGRSVLVVDGGAPPPAGLDRTAHAGTLAMELSIGRERLIVNCGGAPAGGTAEEDTAWAAAARATAAHSTLTVADINSSELRPHGLGRRPSEVIVQRQEANGAHWLEASHDGWRPAFGAIHHRRLYLAESGEDIRGEDSLEAPNPVPYAVRFHLHPQVQAALQSDGETVVMRLPGGGSWRFRAEGAQVQLEESVYLGSGTPRGTAQIVLSGTAEGPQHVKWAITKHGPA